MTHPLTPDLRDALARELSDGALRDPSDSYLSEPRGTWAGVAGAVVAPRDTDEVARVVRFAGAHGIAVVPWGGGSGTQGGALPLFGGILLDLKRLDKILEIDEENLRPHPDESRLAQLKREKLRIKDEIADIEHH